MKIYTKTGDTGSTSLLYGKKVSKSDLRIEAYGTVDELNANLGLLIDISVNADINTFLRHVQHKLFVIGSNLASEKIDNNLEKIDLKDISDIENCIDDFTKQLPELKHFILPGGHKIVSLCHICRTVCRRAERMVVRLSEDALVDTKIIVYLNRLSDYFFVLSRKIAFDLGVEEVKWKG